MALVPQPAHGKVDAALSSRMTGSPRKTGEMQSRLTGAKRPFDAVAEDRCFVAYARGDVLPCPYQVAIEPDAISPPRPGRCLLDKNNARFLPTVSSGGILRGLVSCPALMLLSARVTPRL